MQGLSALFKIKLLNVVVKIVKIMFTIIKSVVRLIEALQAVYWQKCQHVSLFAIAA